MVEADGRDFARLPAAPTELDYALHWLAMERVSGALLDVGCAGLRLLANAQRQFSKRCGVDIVSFPAWSGHPQIDARVCNLDEGPLPFADEAFDAVTCLMVIEHVFDPFHAVREIRRVGKPGARVVLAVPNIAGIKRRLELLLGRLPVTSAQFSFAEGSWDGFHLHNFTQRTFDWLLRREGLTPLRWAAQGKLQSLKRWRPSLFGNDLIVLARKSEPQPKLVLTGC